MIQVVLTEGQPPLPVWIDVLEPSREELQGVAENYQLHPALVQDSMEHSHLPKHELHEDTTFIIVRHYDPSCPADKDSVQAMTRKIAAFLGERFLITIHRKDFAFLQTIRSKYQKMEGPYYLQVILLDLLLAAVETYHQPLEEAESSSTNSSARY